MHRSAGSYAAHRSRTRTQLDVGSDERQSIGCELGQKQLLAEAAAVGQKGLAINDPKQMHQLRQYQGGSIVSALQVACVYDVGVQLLLPGQDAGIDFGREYELAKGMTGGGSAG